MAKLSKIAQKLFGSGAGFDQITKFGSTFAGSNQFTTDVAAMMSLSNWLTGWYAAAIGGNAPVIQDMNAVHTVLSYQLGYLMQTGVAEWDATTIYFIGSIVNDGTGALYASITDNNANNAVSDATNWKAILGKVPVIQRFLANGTYTPTPGCLYAEIEVIGAGGGSSGSGTTGSGGSGGNGGSSSFNGTTVVCTGGRGGIAGSASGGAGGTLTINSPATEVEAFTGGQGNGGEIGTNSDSVNGGAGGQNPKGGAGSGGVAGNAGGVPAVNSGAGAGSPGQNAAVNATAGYAGGAGAYAKFILSRPLTIAASFAVVVGTGGTAGAAGTAGAPGTVGADGLVTIKELFS